jgi:raffinose/stachyose/melibiose transport system substrate-binding protein
MFGDGRWDDPVFVEATDMLLKLHRAGYFGPNPLAIGYQDAITKFWRGETPMYFTGSWVIADAVRDLGDKISDFSVFPVPPPVEGKPIYVAEDIGSGWYVNARTKYPREAGELLNFLFFRPESRKILLEAGHVPVGPLDLEGVKIPELLKEVFTISNKYRSNGTIHAFLDTVMPANVTEVTYDGLQALLAGQMTPEQFCQAVQAAWEEAKAEGTILKPGGIRQR